MDCQPYYVELLEAGRYAQAHELALSLRDDYSFWLTLREFVAEKNLSPESLANLIWGSAQHPEYERYYASAILNHMLRRHRQLPSGGAGAERSTVVRQELESMLREGMITHAYIAAMQQQARGRHTAQVGLAVTPGAQDSSTSPAASPRLSKHLAAELAGLHALQHSLGVQGQGRVTRAADTLRYGSYGGIDWQLLRNELVRLLKPRRSRQAVRGASTG